MNVTKEGWVMSRFYIFFAMCAMLFTFAACGDDWTEDGTLTNAIQSDSEEKSSSSEKAKSNSNETSDSSSNAKSSSSKDDKSNTSDEKNSSSSSEVPTVSVVSPCKTETEDNCEYGTLTDDRDGQTYKTVKIGEQWWMAENLNYETEGGSYCYNHIAKYCEKYGQLYTWATAMYACPEGWHLPDTTEWSALFNAVGGKTTAGKMLKSTEGWNDYYESTWNGSDAYSFSALPAGYRYYGGSFDLEGSNAYFWSSTGKFSKLAYDVNLYYSRDDAYLSDAAEGYGFSVRCLKDYGPDSEKMSSNDKSSSSEKNSSSSSVVSSNSSSSSVVPTVSVVSPCKTEAGDNCEYGTLTDDRDGQTYKTVKIGEQWWMAENLNYAYTGVPFKVGDFTSDSTSWCYDNDAANCAKYGRLYTWAAAMDSAGIIPGNSANGCGYEKDCNLGNVKVRGVCPEGWHLPSRYEWITLLTAAGGIETAGIMLKSTEGWISNGNGSDAYSFSALPAGSRYDNGLYLNEGYYTNFWSSTEDDSGRAYGMRLIYNYVDAGLGYDIKIYGFSVRCLKD